MSKLSGITAILGVTFAAVIVTEAGAEPSPTVSQLMNTPISAFSFGLWRVDNFMGETSESLRKIDPEIFASRAQYQWDMNTIELEVISMSADDEKTFEEKCSKIIDRVRVYANLGGFSSFFFPVGYQTKSDAGLQEKIKEMFVIWYRSRGVGGSSKNECSGRLVEEGVSIRKN